MLIVDNSVNYSEAESLHQCTSKCCSIGWLFKDTAHTTCHVSYTEAVERSARRGDRAFAPHVKCPLNNSAIYLHPRPGQMPHIIHPPAKSPIYWCH